MKIRVKAKPNSKIEGIRKIDENSYEIRVSVPPEKGKANERIIEILSEHFKVPKTKIHILKGGKHKEKIVNLEN